MLLSASLGAIYAGLIRLFVSDHAFDTLLISKYLPPPKTFDDPSRYIPYALVVGFTIALVFAIQLPKVAVRGIKSWWLGVTSGLWFLPFVITLFLLSATRYRFRHRLLAEGVAIIASIALGAWHHCRAIARRRHIPDEKDIQVSTAVKNVAGTELSESDDPIQTWSEDSLGRAALVDSLSVKLLISKAPVIALFGEFGSGKTSILNLLREHLDVKAIVISFSTWLPGSQETLTSYPSFIRRMRARYGRDVDVEQVDITSGDAASFNLWGMQPPKYNVTADPEDRAIQYDFWRRYIGNNKLRLVRSFAGIFLPQGLIDGPTDPFVENKLDVATIHRLNEELPDGEILTDYDRQAERKLQRFLNGDFKNGVGFENIDDPGDAIEEAAAEVPDEGAAAHEP